MKNLENNLENLFTKFYNDIQKILKRLNIIRPKNSSRPGRVTSNELKRLIKMKTECEDDSELKQIKEKIKNEISKINKERYKKFIESGCEFLRYNDHRSAWRFIKMHSNLNKIESLKI